jgi:hypothetical protein
MKKLIFFLLILLAVQIAYALDTNSIKYMPLQVGNSWTYTGYQSSAGGNSTYWAEKFSVVLSRNVNNHLYYFLNSDNNILFKGYYRVDSITGSLYKYDSTGSCANYHFEILIDSLASIIGDTVRNCGDGSYKCSGITNLVLFGDSTAKIGFGYSFSVPPFYMSYGKIFVRKYGFQAYSTSGSGGMSQWYYSLNLKGCKINGIVYGDTSLTGIYQNSRGIPEHSSLSQNYPNPFNPNTYIKYQITNNLPRQVTLKIFDILGKEIATLVNEKQSPGTYEVNWNGSAYPSGVYFYKLVTGDFTETKKMILLK